MTLTPAQIEILRQALALRMGIPTRNDFANKYGNDDPDCEAMVAGGLMSRCEALGGGVFYTVTGAGVREVCPDAKAAVYLPTGDDVAVFPTPGGRFKMRWDGPGKGRFVQGKVYRVSDAAVRVKEAT